MLAITRQNGKKIYLTHPDGRIEVVLIETRSNRAIIGFVAPASVTIWRAELGEMPKPPKQGEEAIPEIFYKADRERAHVGMNAFQLAYVERLEAAVKASDAFWNVMQCKSMLLGEYALSEALFDANESVNFCSERDPEPAKDELPRDVIFS